MCYRIALVGNPNTGKTTLFNRLSGARAKTSNFPGTTTAARIGRATLANGAAPIEAEIVDLPGLYRLGLSTPESTICREVLAGQGLYHKPDAVVVVVDACNLTRNLVLVGELLAYDEPVVVALNMVDLAQRRGLTLDAAALSKEIGCPVVPIVARRGEAVDRLASIVADVLKRGESHTPLGLDGDQALEAWADKAVAASVTGVGSGGDSLTQRLDEAFTHPILGILVFAGVMGGMFWTLFALAQLPMDLIEAVFAQLGSWVNTTLPAGRDPRSHRRRHHRRHRRHRGVPAADLPAVLPDQPARGHRLPGPRGVRDGPAAVPVRPARPRLRPAALEPRLRPAGDHGGAADPRSARPAGDDPRRAAHELFGAPAGLRLPDQHAVRRAAALRRGRVRRLLPARRPLGARQRRGAAPHAGEGHGAADGAGAAELQGAVVHQRADLGARSGLRLPQDRRHDHHGDQRGDVVAERLPDGRRRARGGRAAAARRGHRRSGRRPGAARPRPTRCRRGRSSSKASPGVSAASPSPSSRRSATTGSSPSASSPASSPAKCSSRPCRCCSAARTIPTSPIPA